MNSAAKGTVWSLTPPQVGGRARPPLIACTDDLVILARAGDEGRVLVSGDHDFVQMLFASGATYPYPSLVLVREVESISSADLAVLLLAALSIGLADLLPAGAIATLTPDRARVRPLPLRPDVRA
jgi:predicted nuclease of predicted toxin-antitoxin system